MFECMYNSVLQQSRPDPEAENSGCTGRSSPSLSLVARWQMEKAANGYEPSAGWAEDADMVAVWFVVVVVVVAAASLDVRLLRNRVWDYSSFDTIGGAWGGCIIPLLALQDISAFFGALPATSSAAAALFHQCTACPPASTPPTVECTRPPARGLEIRCAVSPATSAMYFLSAVSVPALHLVDLVGLVVDHCPPPSSQKDSCFRTMTATHSRPWTLSAAQWRETFSLRGAGAGQGLLVASHGARRRIDI